MDGCRYMIHGHLLSIYYYTISTIHHKERKREIDGASLFGESDVLSNPSQREHIGYS